MKGLAISAGMDVSKDNEMFKGILRLYFGALKSFDISTIETAAKRLLLTWEYNRMPPLAVIVKAINGAQPRIEDLALVEANKILDHVRQHGATRWPELSDPVTRRLMTTRWYYPRWAANCIESENHWWVRQFCEAYRATDSVQPALEIPGQVKPLIEGIGNER
jgi:hypothetical protein